MCGLCCLPCRAGTVVCPRRGSLPGSACPACCAPARPRGLCIPGAVRVVPFPGRTHSSGGPAPGSPPRLGIWPLGAFISWGIRYPPQFGELARRAWSLAFVRFFGIRASSTLGVSSLDADCLFLAGKEETGGESVACLGLVRCRHSQV